MPILHVYIYALHTSLLMLLRMQCSLTEAVKRDGPVAHMMAAQPYSVFKDRITGSCTNSLRRI